jgi:hypothetical protein
MPLRLPRRCIPLQGASDVPSPSRPTLSLPSFSLLSSAEGHILLTMRMAFARPRLHAERILTVSLQSVAAPPPFAVQYIIIGDTGEKPCCNIPRPSLPSPLLPSENSLSMGYLALTDVASPREWLVGQFARTHVAPRPEILFAARGSTAVLMRPIPNTKSQTHSSMSDNRNEVYCT